MSEPPESFRRARALAIPTTAQRPDHPPVRALPTSTAKRRGGQSNVCTGKVRVDPNRLLETLEAACVAVFCELVPVKPGLQENLVGVEVFCRATHNRRLFSSEKFNLEVLDDGQGDLVLNREHVLQTPIETLRPKVGAVLGVDELCRDPQPIASFPNAPLDDGANVECRTDLPHVLVLALESESRRPRDRSEALDLRQSIDDLLCHPVAEILLFGVGRDIGKRQNRN